MNAAERELSLTGRPLGITVLEIMPLGQFAGRWGWGYDGVDMFAPHNAYGTPDELRHFIDTAHGKVSRSFWMSSIITLVQTATI